MEIFTSRARLSGSAPYYSYRALVRLDDLDPARRHHVPVLHVATSQRRIPCARMADVIAPDRWFERHLAVPCGLAARLGLVARRLEAILLRAIFPEMVAYLTPPALLVEHDPGSIVHQSTIIDLNGSFDWLASRIDDFRSDDLGLRDTHGRRAA